MEYPFNVSVILAIMFFTIPVVFKMYSKQNVDLSDLIKITLAAMALPNLIICLFYLITAPLKAIDMAEAPQYLTIAVLVIIYLSIQEIKQAFEKDTS